MVFKLLVVMLFTHRSFVVVFALLVVMLFTHRCLVVIFALLVVMLFTHWYFVVMFALLVVVVFTHWCLVTVFTLLVVLFMHWCFVINFVPSPLMLHWSVSPMTLRILALVMVDDVLAVIVVGGLGLVIMDCNWMDVLVVRVFRLVVRVQNFGFMVLRVLVDVMLFFHNVSMARVVGLPLVIVLLVMDVVMVSRHLSVMVDVIIVMMVDDLGLVVVSQALVFLVLMAIVMRLLFPLIIVLLVAGVVMVDELSTVMVSVIIVVMVDNLGLVVINQMRMRGVGVLAEEMLVDEGVVHGWDFDVVGHLFRVKGLFREMLSKGFKMNWFILLYFGSLYEGIFVVGIGLHLEDQVTSFDVGIAWVEDTRVGLEATSSFVPAANVKSLEVIAPKELEFVRFVVPFEDFDVVVEYVPGHIDRL